MIKLEKPLAVLDLETTGTEILEDQIIEIGIWRIEPDGSGNYYEWKVRPLKKMNPQASKVLGITDEQVQQHPHTFPQIARQVEQVLTGCDFCGFNSDRFDIPILMEEFARAGITYDFGNTRTIDVMKIFHAMNPRNLNAASKLYLGEDLENHHTAKADVMATGNILFKMIEKHSLGQTMDILSQWNYRGDWADFTGHLVYNDMKKLVINFGKNKGSTVEHLATFDPGYLEWIAGSDFSNFTKQLIRDELERVQAVLNDKSRPDLPFPKGYADGTS